jgi:hypothetical protein
MGAKTAEKKDKKLAKGRGEFVPDADVCRIISLGGGTFAYVLDHAGKTLHLRVGTVAWAEALKSLIEAFGLLSVTRWLSQQFGPATDEILTALDNEDR